MAQGKRVPDETRAKIVAAYRAQSAKQVGLRFGIHAETVLQFVREAGEPVRPLGRNIVSRKMVAA